MSDENFRIRYGFQFPDGRQIDYDVNLDPKTLDMVLQSQKTPEWTKLGHGRCSVCSLEEKTTPHCPVAVGLANLVEYFKNEKSFAGVNVVVIAPDRSYFKKTTVQEGLHSIFGLIMATSGCPATRFLKPMARFHLPFASVEETIVRTLSFYLMGQFIRKKNNQPADFELKTLNEAYENLQKLNQHFVERLRPVSKGDADLNAVINLDLFAQLLPMEISNNLDSVQEFFKS